MIGSNSTKLQKLPTAKNNNYCSGYLNTTTSVWDETKPKLETFCKDLSKALTHMATWWLKSLTTSCTNTNPQSVITCWDIKE